MGNSAPEESTEKKDDGATILAILKKTSFIEKVIILILTAVLTGLLIPIVSSKMEENTYRERKKFEADLIRQTKVIEYQSQLLEELTELLWQYQALLLEPTYYKDRKDEEGYRRTFEIYDEKAPALFRQIRSKISHIKRLASPKTYNSFRELYYTDMTLLDVWLTNLERDGVDSRGNWHTHHVTTWEKLGDSIDKNLHLLAKDFWLIYEPKN